MVLQELREKANRLPLKPGVYIMKNAAGAVIYVGKAKKLKNRVSSYFHGEHNAKTEAMVSKVSDFDVILAASEFEALMLENSLIKHHMPKYNILLRDDKGYPFIRVDVKSEYPTFSVVSGPAKDSARYFGPYGGRRTTFEAIESICKALKLPTCRRKFPRDIGKERPCLHYHMGNCRGYCLPDVSQAEYRAAMEEAMLILEGKTGSLLQDLQSKMTAAAEDLRFELAAEYRDRIAAVEKLQTHQRAFAGIRPDSDVIGFYRGQVRSCFVVLHYVGGKLLEKEFEMLETPMEEDGEALSALVRQYYTIRGSWPKTVCLPCALPDAELLEQMFSEKAGHRVYLTVPARGEKAALVQTANLNAREETERVTSREEKITRTMEWLQKALGMDRPPVRIEAYDISNTGASDIVASMTCFVRGRPLKKEYRKFRIKTLEGPDDYASMAEVLSRRFRRYLDGDEKFSQLPDLLLIDGGANHAEAARAAMEALGLSLPVFGMVKDDRHRTRALISPEGQEIGISGQPAVFAFVGTIQEETHRSAITYHRSLRQKSVRSSTLDRISGVGEKRKLQLLKAFGSIRAIRQASLEDLCKVVPKNTAGAVFSYFHGESGGE